MLYVSDHGENLYDSPETGIGRGFENLSTHLYHVPMFLWASDSYLIQNKLKWTTLKQNSNSKTSAYNLIFTISDLAGIYWKDFDSTLSLSNKDFQSKDRYFLLKQKAVNFDEYFQLNLK
jgi:heptose-I-phosphate ethanolaminephosphotransferase